MHVADITLFFALHSGGVRRYLLAKRRHLARQGGVHHSIVVPGKLTGEEARGVITLKSPPLPFSGYRFPVRREPWVRRLCGLAPDVIEAGDPYTPAWAALEAGDRLGIPVTIFAHSDLRRVVAARFGRLAGVAAKSYVRRLYRKFDLCLAPSQSTADELKELGLDRVVCQPLGVDAEIYHPRRRDSGLRAELGLPANTRLVIFAGRAALEKNIPLLVRAVEGMGAPYHLLLVGGRVRARPNPRITLLPFVDDEEGLARLLASADALVHAGDRETFGLVVLEAMACGRPVIVVNRGATRELVDEKTGLIARANDVRSLQEAIWALYRNDFEAMGQRARERVDARYTWEHVLSLQLARYALLTRRQPLAVGELSRIPGAM
jgi:alpha-1,6-mannosyltransferase